MRFSKNSDEIIVSQRSRTAFQDACMSHGASVPGHMLVSCRCVQVERKRCSDNSVVAIKTQLQYLFFVRLSESEVGISSHVQVHFR